VFNPISLSGKTVLITGASDGIGKATAILSSQLGANVIMLARSEEKLMSVMDMLEGKGHSWYSYDLKDVEGLESFIKKIVGKHGAFDGLVHSAGISKIKPLKMISQKFLHDIMLINFYSFIELVRCLSKRGSYNEGMSIVAMSSIAGSKGFKGYTAYSSTKAAIDGAIRSMAKELADKNIRINSIIAGMVKTNMYERFKDKTGTDLENPIYSIYSLGLGEAIDIANAIAFLLSDSSRIITGTGLTVDSGATT